MSFSLAVLRALEIDMDEGKQFYITKINLIGSDQQTLEKASQNLRMHPGDLFNERLLERFSQNYSALLNPKRVSNVQLLKLDEKAGTVDITFDFRRCTGE